MHHPLTPFRIISLHIYQYPKFSNPTFHFSPSPLQLIYPLNHPPKTTIISFIQTILFPFPKTKKYQPK
ncbi:AAA family ATPase, partial [Bacillus subtilis]|uniref:AAA family ATPase n=1 Tax=Bacillus subtilis TaxID=1423 RepID=UPI0011A95366